MGAFFKSVLVIVVGVVIAEKLIVPLIPTIIKPSA